MPIDLESDAMTGFDDSSPTLQIASTEDVEAEAIARDQADRFMNALDPALREYVRLRIDADASGRQYADALHVTIGEIRNLQRRLCTRRSLFDALGYTKRSRSFH